MMSRRIRLLVLGVAAFEGACGGTSHSGGTAQGLGTDTSSATGSGNATMSDIGASSGGGSGGTAPGSTSGSTSEGGSFTVAGASGGWGGTGLGVSGAGGEAIATSTTEGTTGLPSRLNGYWLVLGASGDCIDVMEYLFFTDSQMQHIVDDQDACMSPDSWSTTYDDGTYTLAGRTLTYELDSGARKRFNVMLGTLGTTEVLFHSVFVPAGAGVWRSDTSLEQLASDGDVEFSNDVSATITFDHVIPSVGEGTCTATIDFSVNQFDIDAADGETQHDYSGSVDDLPCNYGESDRGQEITFEGLSFDAHPNYVAANVTALFAAGHLWMPPDGAILFANTYVKEDGIPERLR